MFTYVLTSFWELLSPHEETIWLTTLNLGVQRSFWPTWKRASPCRGPIPPHTLCPYPLTTTSNPTILRRPTVPRSKPLAFLIENPSNQNSSQLADNKQKRPVLIENFEPNRARVFACRR